MFAYDVIRLEKYMLKPKRKVKIYKIGINGDVGKYLKIKQYIDKRVKNNVEWIENRACFVPNFVILT